MATKLRHKNHIIETKSLHIIDSIVPSEWVVRKLDVDYGIDLDIEIFEKSKENLYETLSEHLLIQVKGTESISSDKVIYFPRGDGTTERCIKYTIDTSELQTIERMGAAVPVLLFLVEIKSNTIYFLCLNDYIELVLLKDDIQYRKKKSKTIYIPESNKICSCTDSYIMKWYSKRAKLYSAFNRIHSMWNEMQYTVSIDELESLNDQYINEIIRLDIWSGRQLWELLDYYYEMIIQYKMLTSNCNKGTYNSEKIYQYQAFPELITKEHVDLLFYSNRLWKGLLTISELFERVARKFWLPVWIGY